MLGWKAWPENSTNVLKMGSQEEICAELGVGHSVQIRGGLNASLSKTLDSANSGSGKGIDLATIQKREKLRIQGPVLLAL